jgi:hypothetical protein
MKEKSGGKIHPEPVVRKRGGNMELTLEHRDYLKKTHVPDATGHYCEGCNGMWEHWPCDIVMLLSHVEALEAEVRFLRELVSRLAQIRKGLETGIGDDT